MAKYTLQTLEGQDIVTKSKKDAAIKAATDQSLTHFRVVTEKGTVVYEQVPEGVHGSLTPEEALALVGEAETPAEETVEADLPAEEPTAGDSPAEEPSEPEVLYYEVLEFPGNYSIVTAPGALEIAAAAGVPAKSENVKGSLTRKVHLGGDDMDKAQAVAAYIPQAVSEALADLKDWQKKHIERRRSLTDMQRYVEHRDFIAKQMHKSALAVKKNGIPA